MLAALRRLAPGAAAFALTAVLVAVQEARLRDPHVVVTRFALPAFDAHVYVAMAEEPRVFTVAPWGYRLLTPALVHAVSGRTILPAFRMVTLVGLSLAGLFTFVFLRHLGHGVAPSLMAVGVLAVTPPVRAVLRGAALGDPAVLAVETAFLAALQAGAPVAVLALLAALGTLGKEVFALFAPLVTLARRRAGASWARAVGEGLAVAAVPLVLPVLLRRVWTPDVTLPPAPPIGALTVAALEGARDEWQTAAMALLLGGLAPVAVLGALRAEARPYLVRFGYLIAALTFVALFAWVNVPAPRPVLFFGADAERLLLYVVPLLLPLALLAVDRVWPHRAPAPEPWRVPRAASVAAGLSACAVLAVPFVLDPYRRVALHGARDGPLVLAVCRETLRTGSRVQRGQEVVFDPADRRFVWGETDPGQLDRMRWFLREGWGDSPHYGTGEVRMTGERAALLVPALAAQALEVGLELEGVGTGVGVAVNGTVVGRVDGDGLTRVRVPASLLFRGDNRLELRASSDGPRPRLLRFSLRRVP